jgi:hypothetical protein
MWRETVTGGLAMMCTAMSPSRYVSDDLVHFVGRSAVSDDDAFSRLAAIIQDGWLLTPTALAIEDRDENVSNFSLQPKVKLSSNDRYIPEMVCFADIPEEALHIHTAKYRRFGLSFSKRFLIGKGARPVLYVPMGAKTQPMAKYEDVGEDWDELADLLPLEINPAFGGTTRSGDQGSPEIGEGPATRIADWIEDDLLAFVKFFDPTLPEDHIDNYYMEREWRTVRNIQFRLSDVAGVYVAPGYTTRLVTMFTDLAGKIAEL